MTILKDLFGLLVIYTLAMLPLALIHRTRGFAARGMIFCSYAFFLIYWGFLTCLSYFYLGNWGVVLSVILTPVGMTPVVLLLGIFHGDWGMIARGVFFLALIVTLNLIGVSLRRRTA